MMVSIFVLIGVTVLISYKGIKDGLFFNKNEFHIGSIDFFGKNQFVLKSMNTVR